MGGLDSMVPSGQVEEKPVTLEAGPGCELKSQWFLASFLCFYGFVTQMRPGESFITPYLLSPDKNFTQKQITNEITPVLSYSYMAVLVPIFLLTDYMRYKPVLVLQGLSYVSVWLLLLLGTTVLHMQFMEFFYSITMAARIAYSPYIFSLVQPVHYQRMAGYSRAAVLLGVFSSSVLGQLLVTVGGVDFTSLNYISLGFLVFSLVVALFLKRPKRSLFFNRNKPVSGAASPSEVDRMHPGPGPPTRRKLDRLRAAWRDCVLVRMLRELGTSLQVPQLRLWSLWWVFNSTGYYLIMYYAHILWAVVHSTPDSKAVYNGGVDAAATLLSALTAFAAGFVEIRWALWAKLVIGVVTAVQAGLVFLLSSTSNIWLCYAAIVLFRGFYQFLVPIATFQIASSLSKELCALVFGINTLLATILNTIITLIVSDKRGLGLSVHSQQQILTIRGNVTHGRRAPTKPCTAHEKKGAPQDPDAQGVPCSSVGGVTGHRLATALAPLALQCTAPLGHGGRGASPARNPQVQPQPEVLLGLRAPTGGFLPPPGGRDR